MYCAIPQDYLESSNISFNIRMILVVQHYLKLSLEFLYLAASILTTFVHSEDVDADKFQLL